MSPSDLHSPRLCRNNFDLLRLLFSSAVCLAHVHALSGFNELAWLPNMFSSVAAVKAFFVVSGFLIFMSYERSPSLRSYFLKRIRRIYPAYVTVVMLCALLLWIVGRYPVDRYFSADWLKYVFSNLSFLNFIHPGLPGVFEGFRFPVVNGALWTLKIEVMFYVSVPLLVWLARRFGYFRMLAACYVISVGYAQILNNIADTESGGIYRELARQLPGQLSYFAAGAFFYYFLPLLERYSSYFLAAAFSILILNGYAPMSLFEPFALATVIAYFGLFLYAGNVGKFGDFSYGIYILHFPIIQVLLHYEILNSNAYGFLALVVALTLFAAILMWHLVEKRFLLRGSHYLDSSQGERGA